MPGICLMLNVFEKLTHIDSALSENEARRKYIALFTLVLVTFSPRSSSTSMLSSKDITRGRVDGICQGSVVCYPREKVPEFGQALENLSSHIEIF